MDPTKPQPQRFAVYNLLPDGKGFTIKGCKFVFKLDRYGGWRDQYGHYYNSNGEPDFEPQDAQLTPSEGSIYSDDHEDEYGEFEPDYEDVDDDQEQTHSSWQIRNMEKISKNLEILSAYPASKPLRVYFSNMSYKLQPKTVYQAYSNKVQGIINIILDIQDQRRNGEGHFIMKDLKNAQQLIKLEGQKVIERQVHFDVQKINELMIDPIRQQDMIQSWNTKKSYTKTESKQEQKKVDDVPKFKAVPAQETKPEKKKYFEKKQQKNQQQTQQNKQKKQETKVQKKEEKKQQKNLEKPIKNQPELKKQTQVKKVPQSQFKPYVLNFQIFQNKTKFFNWFAENKFNKDTDIKSINKEQKDGKIKLTIQIKYLVVEKLNGKQYNGKQVKFTQA